MGITTTSIMTNSVGARYTTRYLRGAQMRRLYDQLAVDVSAPQYELEQRRGMGTSYVFNFLSGLTPSTQAISETADLTPQTIYDAVSTITPTSRGFTTKRSELLELESYTDLIGAWMEKVGEGAMESLEVLAYTAALSGSLVDAPVPRSSLDAGTSAHNWTEAALWRAAAMVESLRCPPFMVNGRKMYIAISHPDAYYDLFHGGNIISAAIYGNLGKEVLLNGEIGEIANFKLVISPFAKVFGAAGAANGSGSSDTYTLSSDAKPLDKTINVTTGTNIVYGRYLTIGTKETGNTFYATNERVRRVSGTTTATIVGSGDNGGLRYEHITGEYVMNSDTVYTVVYGTPGSLVKVRAKETGPFGEVVGPRRDGSADQWTEISWKFYGNYGRVGENYILRGECSSSLDA